MDKCSVETLIKDTLIYYCRNYVGEAVEFKLDGLICITVNSEPVDTVFKIHEVISGSDGLHLSHVRDEENEVQLNRKASNRNGTPDDFNKENKTEKPMDCEQTRQIKVENEDYFSDEEMLYELEKSSLYSCGGCPDFKDVPKQSLVDHLIKDHNAENEFMCFCTTNDCQLGFPGEEQYLEHFHTCHKSSAKDVLLREKDVMRSLSKDNQLSRGINSTPIFPIAFKPISKNQTSSDAGASERPVDAKSEPESVLFNDSNDDLIQTRQCRMCHLDFPDFASCDAHTSSVHGTYMCPYCDVIFKWKTSRDAHLAAHSTDGKLLECSKCLLVFSRLDSLRRHSAKCQGSIYKHSKLPSARLQESPRTHEINGSIDSSLATLFPASDDPLSVQALAEATGIDWSSGFERSGLGYKDEAIEITSEPEGADMEETSFPLEIASAYKRSGRRRHAKYITTLDPSRSFTCEVCMEFVPGGVEAFRIHCSQLHQRVPCPYCGCTYTQKASMERHQRQHTGERPYVCPLCPRSYTRKENLFMHRLKCHPVLEDELHNIP